MESIGNMVHSGLDDERKSGGRIRGSKEITPAQIDTGIWTCTDLDYTYRSSVTASYGQIAPGSFYVYIFENQCR